MRADRGGTGKAGETAGRRPENRVEARVQIVVDPDAPIIYANYLEVAHSLHDFLLLVGRIPAKLPPGLQADSTGVVEVPLEAQAQIVIPPTVVPGLIRALQAQQKSFEDAHGPIRGAEQANEQK